MKLPQRYNSGTDDLIDVTQEWVDEIQKGVNKLGSLKQIIQKVSNLHPLNDGEKITKISNFLFELGL